MSKWLRTGCLLTVALAGLTLLTGLYVAQVRSQGAALNRVAAWMPTSWDADRARASWEAHRADIQELGPVWYQLDAAGDGSISPIIEAAAGSTPRRRPGPGPATARRCS